MGYGEVGNVYFAFVLFCIAMFVVVWLVDVMLWAFWVERCMLSFKGGGGLSIIHFVILCIWKRGG